jgi:hypothetical protein
MKAAKDFAAALAQQYGMAAVYTTEQRMVRNKQGRGQADPYTWPDWRWKLVQTFRANWYTQAQGLVPVDVQMRPDVTGNPAFSTVRVHAAPIPLVNHIPPGYSPRPLPKR